MVNWPEAVTSRSGAELLRAVLASGVLQPAAASCSSPFLFRRARRRRRARAAVFFIDNMPARVQNIFPHGLAGPGKLTVE